MCFNVIHSETATSMNVQYRNNKAQGHKTRKPGFCGESRVFVGVALTLLSSVDAASTSSHAARTTVRM